MAAAFDEEEAKTIGILTSSFGRMTTSAPYVLAIDLGTTAVKVCVIDPSGLVVASASDVNRRRDGERMAMGTPEKHNAIDAKNWILEFNRQNWNY